MTHAASRFTCIGPRRGARHRGSRGFSLIELVVVVGIIIALLGLVLAVSTLLIQQNEGRQLETAFANLSSAVQEYEQAVGRPISYQSQRESSVAGSNNFFGAWDIPNNPIYSQEQGGAYQNLENGPGNYFRLPAGNNQLYFNQGINDGCGSSDGQGWEKQTVALLSLLQRTASAEEIIARLDPSLLQRVTYNEQASLDEQGKPLPPLTKLVDPWGVCVAVVFPGRAWRESDASSFLQRMQTPDEDGTIRTAMEEMLGVCRNGRILFVSAGPDGQLGGRYCSDSNRRSQADDNVYSYEPGNL